MISLSVPDGSWVKVAGVNCRQADLKRAISTAYYAMFHALCGNCADALIGKTKALRIQPAWRQTYRAPEHGFAKNQCKNRLVIDRFPEDIQDFANQFVALQEKRHMADYDPFASFTPQDALKAIEAADIAVRKLQTADIKNKKAFAAWTIMKNRAN